MKHKIISFVKKIWVHIFVTRKFYKIYNFLARKDKINPKKIVFVSYYGSGYGDNGKYIAEYIIKHNFDFELVWLLDKNKKHENFPKQIRVVNYFTFKAMRELSTAKFWIDNARKDFFPKKKTGQIYIQTWHGSGVLKMIEQDAPSLSKRYISKAKEDSRNIDYILSGCEFKSNIFRTKFWYTGEVLNIGTPRADLFFDKEELYKAKKKVTEYYNLGNEIKILMYAPTFRQTGDLLPYNIDYNSLQAVLEKKFGNKWKIFVKLHPNVSKLSNELKIPDYVVNATYYPDMQELLCASEIVISDYSGLMFDFYLLDRPIFLFCLDYKDYILKERNLYFSLKELPFSMAFSNEDLILNIKNFNKDEYLNNIYAFKRRIGLCEKGTACESVVKKIIQKGL